MCAHPWGPRLQADLQRLRSLLGPSADIDALVVRQPRFLDAELVG